MSEFAAPRKPAPLGIENPSFDEKMMQQERIKAYVSRENGLKDNITKIYGTVWRQCTSALQAVVKGSDE